MIEIKEAIITGARIVMEQGITRPYDCVVIENENGVDFVGLLGVIQGQLSFTTSEGEKYGPLKFDLVSDAYVTEDHSQLCQLKDWLVGEKGADIEAFLGKNVAIIVDDERFSRKDTILAFGVGGMYLIPFWILDAGGASSEELKEEKLPHKATITLEILKRRVPIAFEEI